MWLLLVTTVAAAVFADAGYHYNVPNIPFGLPSNQPLSLRPIHVLPQHNINIEQNNKVQDKPLSFSISYKDYVFVKKSNVANSNGHVQQLNPNYNNLHINHHGNNGGLLVSHNVQNNLGGILNNGYAGYVQSANNNNAHPYVLPTESDPHYTTAPIRANIDHAHSIPLHINTNLNVRYVQPNRLFQANMYTHPNGIIQNTGYIQTVSVPNNIDYHSQPLIPTGGHHLNNGYLHGATANEAYDQAAQTTGSLNSAYNHIAQSSASLNTAYSQVAQASASLNNAYSQVAQVSASLNEAYNQVAQISVPVHDTHSQVETSPAEVNLNSGYAPSLHPSPAFDPYGGYSQFVPSPDSSTINFASEEQKLNKDYKKTITSGSSSQVSTGLEQASSTAATISSVTTPIQISTTTDSSRKEKSDSSVGPSHIDLKAGITQLSSSFATSATRSLTSNDAPVDTGLFQNNLVVDAAVNPIRVAVPTNPPVAPIVHRHVYFHVPPPDLEEAPKVVPLPPAPKKNYKILFIKVPSQETNTNVVNLQQQIAQLQNADIEDRTLIYLLVKTPQEPIPVDLPKPKLSEHQVFFVQYNGSPFEIASQVNEELEKAGSVKSIIPLEPGLINGQHK